MIECQVCGRQLGILVGKHLKSHNLTSKEYQALYPGYPVSNLKPWSDELRDKHRKARTGRKHSDETKAKIGAGNRGKKMSCEAIARQQESYKKYLEENGGSPQKGYKRSEEFKERMRQIALNRDPALVQEKLEQMWAARRGQKASDEQRERYSEARLKYITENPDKIISKLFNTKPEQEFEQVLIDRNIQYAKQARIGNRLYDFLVTNCVVELDGPYHREARMHGEPGMPIEQREVLLEQTKMKDLYKTQLAQSLGYRVFRIDVGSHLPDNWYDILKDQGWDLF